MAREQGDTQYPTGNAGQFEQVPLTDATPTEGNMLTAPDGSVVLGNGSAPLIVEAGGINVGRQGHIRGGQSDYNTNSGFFLGYSGGQYKFSVGNPTGNYITWDGTTLTVVGNQVDIQTFLASGTWTKPTGGLFTVVKAWGAGGAGCDDGGGAKVNGAGGGGGYSEFSFPTSSLGTTETVTIGAGGTHAAIGGNGGNSTFGAWVTAYGGAGGNTASTGPSRLGGGGGGPMGAGSAGTIGSTASNAGSPAEPIAGSGGLSVPAGGVSDALYGGGGSGDSTISGGNSYYGGAGGGGGNATAGGTSKFGGNGGAGGSAGVAAVAGSVPGGGGGAGSEAGGTGANGANGGAGKIVVITYL